MDEIDEDTPVTEPAANADVGPATGPRPDPALAQALDRVGDRWSLLLVDALLDGSRRYGELADALPGIAPNVLAERLRRLTRAGVVRAAPYTTHPPRLAYSLTADGRELAGVVRLLADWGSRQTPGMERLRHAVCGTALEARWYCVTCGRAVEEPADEALELI
jgi:DNA-binding HxlR family transcriptional regulator